MTAQLSEYATMMAGDKNGGDGGSSSNDSGGFVTVGADGDGTAVAGERVVLFAFKMEDEDCAADVDDDSSLEMQDVGLQPLVLPTQSPPSPFSDGDQGKTRIYRFYFPTHA
jgi:hypothetical protein